LTFTYFNAWLTFTSTVISILHICTQLLSVQLINKALMVGCLIGWLTA